MEDNFDKDFDSLFARDLGAAGKKERPEPGEWPALSTRLDTAKPQWNGRTWFSWLLLPLLLCCNGWMLLQWQSLREELALVRQKAAEAPVPTVASVVPVSVIRYDTIYRTVVITRQVHTAAAATSWLQDPEVKNPSFRAESAQASPAKQADATQSKQAPADKIAKDIDGQALTEQPVMGNVTKRDDATQVANGAAPAPTAPPVVPDSTQRGRKSLVDSLRHQDLSNRQTQTDIRFDSLLKQSAVLTPPVKRYRAPLHLRLGASAGLPALVAADDLRLSRSIAAQLQLEVGMGRHWALVPSCLYQTYQYQTEHHVDPRLGIGPLPTPGQEYNLRDVEGGTDAIIPALSLQYRFRSDKKISGYLSAGYALRLTQQHKTEFEFVHTGTGVRYLHQNPSQPFVSRSNASLQAGLEYAIRPRLTLWGGLNSLLDLGEPHAVFPVMVGLLGVKYSVK